MSERNEISFDSIEDTRKYLPSFAEGDIVKDWSLRGEDMDDWKHIVWNRTDNKPAAVVSPGYNLLQHKDFFGKFLAAVNQVDYGIDNIEVIDERERAYMHVLFEETWLDDQIKAGIRAGNSFDKNSSAFVEFYALRLVCSNGLMGKKVFGQRSRIHVGEWEVSYIMENVNQIVPMSKEKLEKLVGESQKDFIDTDFVFPILRWKKFSKGLSQRVHDKYRDLGEVDLWELYNGVTYEVEHNKDVRENYREGLHKKANDILVKSGDSLVKSAKNWVEEQGDEEDISSSSLIDNEVIEEFVST